MTNSSLQFNFSLKFWSIICTTIVLLIEYIQGEPCLVNCPAGTYRGTLNSSVLDPRYQYCSYRGMSYGEAPVGNLRFAHPVPAAPLHPKIVFNATQNGYACPQTSSLLSIVDKFSEDCLNLNVYTPQVQGKRQRGLLPVIVFIFGGGFLTGSCNSEILGPDFIVIKDVLLVAMNFRINMFGYLNPQLPQYGGNMGLRDSILALQWVQTNIRSFGGNPNSVTIIGGSSGGISSYLLLVSPLTRGLFNKVILDVPVLTTDYVKNTSVQATVEFAQFAGYSGNPKNRYALLRYLQSLTTQQLVANFTAFDNLQKQTDDYHVRGPPFWPIIDSYARNPVLPTSLNYLARRAPNYPILCGQDSADGTLALVYGEDSVTYIKTHLGLYLREMNPIFVKNKRTEERNVKAVINYYYNNTDNEVDNTVKLATFYLYYDFYNPRISALQRSHRSGNIRLWLFTFDVGGFNFIKRITPNGTMIKGVFHGEEAFYIFYSSFVYKLFGAQFSPTNDQRRVIYQFTTWVTNFAKTGNPNSRFDNIQVDWQPSTPEHNRYLDINSVSRLINKRIHEREYVFFDKLLRSSESYRG